MITLFLMSNIWFDFFMLLTLVALLIFTESGKVGLATITTFVPLLLLQFYGHVKILTWIYCHPSLLFLYLLGYIIIGFFYSLIKWKLYISKLAKDCRSYYTKADGPLKNRADVPRVRDNSKRIIGWMEFWPVSLIWTVINDPLRRIVEVVFEKTEQLFQNIANKEFEK